MIYVVGLGPGNAEYMTPAAHEALSSCDVIVGYKTYVELIADRYSDKELVASPMTRERERCEDALKRSLAGQNVALVSSGDPGVYGMAGIMLEIADGKTEVVVVPGVTAANAAAALLGAPIMHDFAVISLSDLLTPWEDIEKRLEAAAASGFVICLYNLASMSRDWQFGRACEIIAKSRPAETPAGWVRNVGRDGEEIHVTTLGELPSQGLDMFCTAIIGNRSTRLIEGRIVTPRGYEA